MAIFTFGGIDPFNAYSEIDEASSHNEC